MSTYVVGDVQGCFKTFQRLLEMIAFDANNDELIFAGDLISRGENSQGVMHWVLDHVDVCRAVLGNHDLNFLAVSSGLREAKPRDKIDSLLDDSKLDEIVKWYRYCPLVIDFPEQNALIVHAGVWPEFSRKMLLLELQRVEALLQDFNWQTLLQSMYGDSPDHWHDAVTDIEKIRFLINSCTRMRFVNQDTHQLNFTWKTGPDDVPPPLIPWMDAPNRIPVDRQIIFGHWASLLGARRNYQIFALDTGCVWGNTLTALRLEDRAVFEVNHAV